jgi:hypothetical protein
VQALVNAPGHTNCVQAMAMDGPWKLRELVAFNDVHQRLRWAA